MIYVCMWWWFFICKIHKFRQTRRYSSNTISLRNYFHFLKSRVSMQGYNVCLAGRKVSEAGNWNLRRYESLPRKMYDSLGTIIYRRRRIRYKRRTSKGLSITYGTLRPPQSANTRRYYISVFANALTFRKSCSRLYTAKAYLIGETNKLVLYSYVQRFPL